MRQAEVLGDAERRGHVLMRDDRRRGRWAVICTRCGARAEVRPRGLVGTLAEGAGTCFPYPEPEAVEVRGVDGLRSLVWQAWGMRRVLREPGEIPCAVCGLVGSHDGEAHLRWRESRAPQGQGVLGGITDPRPRA